LGDNEVTKFNHWKQKSPIDQYTSIRNALAGLIINLENGIGKDLFISKSLVLCDELQMLELFLKKNPNKWEEI
jgi:hypothetical protein